ncbi:MAG: hypothetical protein J2P34_03285 [Actinobacteria bacterium]|nr:hypothetical protein [Actinomycetota bacterium]
MYEMYRWDADEAARPAPAPPARQGRAGNGAAGRPDEAARAVQEALDRRDNGGDSAARER